MRIRRFRWWFAALLTVLALVGVGLVALSMFVRLYGPAFAREHVEALLSEVLGYPTRVAAVRLSPWRGRVSLSDLQVGADPIPPGGVGLRATAIDVSVAIASLWRRQLTVSVLATDLSLDATVPATGAAGPALFPLPQSFALGPLSVSVGSIRIKGGDVVVRAPEASLTVEVAGADVTAWPVAGDLDVFGRVEALRVGAFDRHEQLDQVTLDGRLSADRIQIRRVGWRWQGELMQLDGDVRHPWVAGRELSLRLNGDIALATLARVAGSDHRIDGKIQVAIDGQWAKQTLRLDDVQARFGTGRLRGKVEAALQGGAGTRLLLELREVVLPGSLTSLGRGTAVAEGRVHDGGVDLTRAQASWRGLAVSLGGRIASGPALAMHSELTADLQQISQALTLGSLSGHATVSADLNGRGQTPTIEGRAEIVDLVASGSAFEPVEASFRFAASRGSGSRWEGTVQSPRIRWSQIAVESIAASLAVDGQRLQVTRASARAAAIPVEATGVWEWAGSGRSHAELGPVPLGAIAGIPPSLRLGGTGHATVEASVDRGITTARVRATLDQASAAGVSLGVGQAEMRVRGPALDSELSFPARRLRAKASGRLETGSVLTSTLEVDELALQPLLSELGSAAADYVEGRLTARGEASIPLAQPASGRGVVRLTPVGLRLLSEPWASQGPVVLRWEGPRVFVESFRLEGPSGRLSAAGALIDPEGRGLSLALDNARLPGALGDIGRGGARGELRLAGGDVELTRLDAQWPGLVAAASGHVRGDGAIGLTGRVEAELARLAPAIGVTGIGGRATLTADARGRSDAIQATGSLRAPQIQLQGATVRDVELPLRLTRSSLRLEKGQARLGESRLGVDASATWPQTGPLTADTLARQTVIQAELRAPAVRLEDVAPLLPSAVQGRGQLALTARAEGTPGAWSATGTLTSPLMEIGPGPIRQLRAAFTVDNAGIDVTELSVDAFGIPTRGTVTWAWTSGGSAKATLGPASLTALQMVPPAAGLQGTARVTIDVAGSSAVDVTGTVRTVLEDVAVGGVALGRGQFDVSAQDGAFRADLAFPEPRLQALVRGRVDTAGTLDTEATVQDIDLARLTRTLGLDLAAIGGTVSARATARVPLAEPWRGDGVVSIDPLRIAVAGDTWESASPIQIRWAQGGFSLAEFRLAAKRDGFVTGAGTVGTDGKLDGRASAQIPLAALGATRPEISELTGVLELSVRASGTLAAPAFVGDGAIHRANLLLRDRPEALRDIEARFTLSRQGVQVRDATASLGGGRVRAQGDLALQGWKPGAYRFKLQARDVAVGPIEDFSSAWDADLELSGITREAQLTGRARLARGVYRRDVSVLSLVLSRGQAVAVEPGTPLRVRVRVDLDDNLVVRSRTVNLRAGGVLTVEGTTTRPVVFGSVESRDGRINFRTRDWSITSATVRFADPRRLDPYLDVLATTRIAEYDVTMQVVGPVSNIAVRFSSTPRLSQNDLLSLVAFGATSASLRESPETVLLGEAGKMLAQQVLGVDASVPGLQISTGSSTDSANEMHGFTRDDRAPVGPSRTTPGARKDTVRVEYQLWAPLYLSGEYDRDYGYGADVVLRFRFR
jgi:autotransporter translocation and assembly factor TamB